MLVVLTRTAFHSDSRRDAPPKSVAEPHQTLPTGASGFRAGVKGPGASTIAGYLGMSPQTPPRLPLAPALAQVSVVLRHVRTIRH